MKWIALGLILISILASNGWAEDKTLRELDGNNWRGWGQAGKGGYVLGFMVGINYVAEDNMEFARALRENMVLSNLDRFEIYNITVNQILDGLDKLYEDFKNRNIKISDGFYVVKGQIQGTPNEDIERILLYLRGEKKIILI